VKRLCDACERAMRIVYRDQEWDVKGGQTARAAIKKVDLDPEAVLVIRNGQLVTDDIILEEGDEVKLIAVISGGASARRSSRG
jgi:sulfur carrier protein ThiS